MLEKNKLPQLMVPANNLNVLKYAVKYGADAVYAGGKKFNLRSIRGNFSIPDLEQGVNFAHNFGSKVYLTLNSFISEDEIGELIDYLYDLKEINFDGIIISDLSLIDLIKKIMPLKRIHISTQTNTMNHLSIKKYKEMGASRINISREINFNQLKSIIANSDLEIEVFVHGALCISYSGRCMLSKYMSGRDANKGECAHSCRWKYYLMEEERPNLYFPIEQDKKGTYIYNSRDLCLLSRLRDIVEAGVSAIKIEGRMKTENYVSITTWVYRKALEFILNGEFNDKNISYLLSELDKCSHRNFTMGFLFSDNKKELDDNDNVGYINKYRFIGVFESYSQKYNGPVIYAKNQFKRGEIIDILQPGKMPVEFLADKILLMPEELEVDCINTNNRAVICGMGVIDEYSILRVRRR